MSISKRLMLFGTILILYFVTGCVHYHKFQQSESLPSVSDKTKVQVEAYLFDAVIRHDGKPTTIRLELFDADSVMALSGRAYLGKGALRGRMTSDSLIVYFPTSDEYVQDEIVNMLHELSCKVDISRFNILRLFKNLPDSITMDQNLKITSDYSDKKQPLFIITAESCAWQMSLNYRQTNIGWRIQKIDYFDGVHTYLTADCREFRENQKIPKQRFLVTIPSAALRVTP
jgi:hypothetical protein